MAEKHPLSAEEKLTGFLNYGSDQKRVKLEDQVVQGGVKGNMDPHNAPPSRVIHARAVPDGCTHTMLINTLSRFGRISYITMMPKLRQSLVEFETIEGAIGVVQYCQERPETGKPANQIFLMERPVYFNYSTSQEITRSPYGITPNNRTLQEPNEPATNHILLFTIFNPLYPITVEVIRTICTPYGFVQRIVIFRKNGLQVLVEFESDQSAQRAKQQLDGADIYAGCCTLKIEYARTDKLNVFKNDEMTFDFTVQGQRLQSNFPRMPLQQHQQQPPIRPYASAPYGAAPQPATAGGGAPSFNMMANQTHNNTGGGGGGMGGGGGVGNGSVIMLYGLPANRFNCDHLFNLVCSYGNVLKIKILTNKPGTAMVHMENPQGAKNAIQYLHGQKLFGQTIELNFSRHSYIADYSQGDLLYDSSPCWKDYSQTRNNRFTTAEGTSKNRIVAPGKVMHFYNSPPDSTEESLIEIFTKLNIPPPTGIKFFSQGAGAKSATGLMEWIEMEVALEAFIIANHQTVYSQAGQAYTFKLAFSNNTSLDGPNTNSSTNLIQ